MIDHQIELFHKFLIKDLNTLVKIILNVDNYTQKYLNVIEVNKSNNKLKLFDENIINNIINSLNDEELNKIIFKLVKLKNIDKSLLEITKYVYENDLKNKTEILKKELKKILFFIILNYLRKIYKYESVIYKTFNYIYKTNDVTLLVKLGNKINKMDQNKTFKEIIYDLYYILMDCQI